MDWFDATALSACSFGAGLIVACFCLRRQQQVQIDGIQAICRTWEDHAGVRDDIAKAFADKMRRIREIIEEEDV